MGAILCIIITVIVYTIKILHNSRNLTFDKWCEIFISFFIFSNCLNFGLTYFNLGNQHVDGALGMQLRLEVYMIITPIFFIVLAQRQKWHFLPLPWYVFLGIIAFCAVNIFNPNNLATGSTIVALIQIITYLIFLYIICSSVPIEVIMRGVFEGFAYTVILEAILALCFPVLGIHQVIDLFREGRTSIRSGLRPGAPGTFGHPNALGAYSACIFIYFASCILLKYKQRQSIIYASLAFFTLFLTYSRSALLGTIFAVGVIYLIYATRNGSIFTIKNIFYRIIPILILSVLLIFFTPIKNSFIGSNVDEMFIARLMHYYCGIEAFTDHPFIGVGFNTHLEYIRNNINPRIFAAIDATGWRPEEFMFTNPVHNIWLIFLVELGVIGCIPIICFIIAKFVNIKRQLRRDSGMEYHVFALFTIGLISYLLVHGMSDWALLNSRIRNIWIFAFFVFACAKQYKTSQSASPMKY